MPATTPKPRKKTFWELCDAMPPILVRLLACKKTDGDIARLSGLPGDRIFLIEQMTAWDGIDVPTQRKYLIGCEVDFCNDAQMHKIKMYLGLNNRMERRPAWKKLRLHPHWKTFYAPLLKRYRQSLHSNHQTYA